MTDERGVDADAISTILAGFAHIDRAFAEAANGNLWDVVAQVAAAHVPGTEWASISVPDRARVFRTAAQTDERALRADLVQYELGSGPCVDAIVDRTIYCPTDIAHDDRWPQFGHRVAREFGVRSMLSFRIGHDGGDLLGGLNLYSTRAHAFGPTSVLMGEVVATRAGAVAGAAASRNDVQHVESALASNRDIGVAMGVLMRSYLIDRDQAFGLLRMASQNQNRKLRDIAREVGDTGQLILERPSAADTP